MDDFDWVTSQEAMNDAADEVGAAVYSTRNDLKHSRAHGRVETRVLIVDDCILFRECLVGVLTGRDNGVAVDAAWDLPSVLTRAEAMRPHVILLSMATRDSAMLLRQMVKVNPGTPVVVVGVSEDDEAAIVECAEAGAAGYHLRSESVNDLMMLIRNVAAGESACSSRVSGILLRRLSALAAQRQPASKDIVLTTREIEILRMIEAGMANREIADNLCIAVHTVKNHVHSVLTKLGVRTREQAGVLARNMLAI
ncbi:LuxR C-terminal-related transcriptional regulator [Mycobacterium sp. SMC-4]|uniref:LuxR C-terminal-related transcriptional regulator n=1 Tax=Mycobacterium sp. SMC-4 TaxID=2857059 RepID=UPI003D072EDE